MVWNLKSPPRAVLRNEQKLGLQTIDKAAREVVESFDLDHIIGNVRTALESAPGEFGRFVASARDKAVELLATIHLLHLPSRADIRQRAGAILAKTRSMDDIVERAHLLLLERVCAKVPIGG